MAQKTDAFNLYEQPELKGSKYFERIAIMCAGGMIGLLAIPFCSAVYNVLVGNYQIDTYILPMDSCVSLPFDR